MKPRHMHLPGDCRAISDVLSRVGDKWSVLVVTRLGERPMRFNELRRSIGGISQRMLTLTLRGLERDGLATRTVFPTIPPRVDYALTPLGRDLLEPVSALGDWALRNQPKIARARERFDSLSGKQDLAGAA
jgi:DNA-binding HxlR family transcriptional regulator